MKVRSQYGKGLLVWVGVDHAGSKLSYRILLEDTTEFKNCECLEVQTPDGWLRLGQSMANREGPYNNLYQINVLSGQTRGIHYVLANCQAEAEKLVLLKVADNSYAIEQVKLLTTAELICATDNFSPKEKS